MDNALTLLLSQGPIGIIAGIFVWLYLAERKSANEHSKRHNEELRQLREENYVRLDQVRQAQIAREQEIARTLDEYGRSVVEAVDRAAFLAEELRRLSRYGR